MWRLKILLTTILIHLIYIIHNYYRQKNIKNTTLFIKKLQMRRGDYLKNTISNMQQEKIHFLSISGILIWHMSQIQVENISR